MMMKRGLLFLLSLFISALFTNVMRVNAVNTGFVTEIMPSDKKARFISNVDLLPTDGEPLKRPVVCLDVNSSGFIAIGQKTPTDRPNVCIYSSEGVFQYGYAFNCSGDFGLEWDEENLNIYLFRSNAIISVNSKGDVLDVLKVPNTTDNNSYINHFIHSVKRKIGDTEYYIRNDFGLLGRLTPTYSQIVVKNSDGVEKIIYDVESQLLPRVILIVCFNFGIFVAAIILIARKIFMTGREENR